MQTSKVDPDRLRTGPLDEKLRAKVAALVHSHGEKLAAQSIGLSRHATARAMAGMPIFPGTQLMILRYFEMAAGGESSGG